MSHSRALIHLGGLVVSGCTVCRRAATQTNGHIRWWVSCHCGASFQCDGEQIRKAMRGGRALACPACRKTRRASLVKVEHDRGCRHCGSTTHYSKTCPTRRVETKRPCRECEDMPWRRPEDGSPCRCGGVYAPEPGLVVTDFTRRSVERVVVF